MRRFVTFLFVSLLLLPSTAQAQGVLIVSQNKCPLDKVPQIRQLTDSLWTPIAQELVNEGKLQAAGSAYHSWGDEWNVVLWYTAADLPTFLSAWRELTTRVGQRQPSFMPQFLSWCSEHRDSFYNQGKSTTPAATAPRRP